MSRAGEVWEFENDKIGIVVADDGKVVTVIFLYEEDRGWNNILVSNVHGTRYGNTHRMRYVWASDDDVFVRKLDDTEYAEVKKCMASMLGIDGAGQNEELFETKQEMNRETAELKEFIADLEASNGSLNQAKTARLILNYMKALNL